MKKSTLIVSIAAIIIATIAIHFQSQERIQLHLKDGRTVPGYSESEAGIYAQQKHVAVQIGSYTNSERYAKLTVEPIEFNVNAATARFEKILFHQFEQDATSKQIAATLPPDAVHKLAHDIALRQIFATGEMSVDQYVQELGSTFITLPIRLQPEPGLIIPTNPTKEDINTVFRTYVTLNWKNRGKGYTLKKAVYDSSGLRARLEYCEVTDAMNIFSRRLPDFEFFRGPSTMAAFVFHTTERAPQNNSMCVQFGQIVEDADGDRRPLWLTFWFDPVQKQWYMQDGYECSSVKIMHVDPLAF